MNQTSPHTNTFAKGLRQLERWLDKAAEHATAKKFDPNVLLGARLAPDQFAFVRQVQSACDSAKFACARLTEQKAPSHPDTETTIDELRARVRAVVEYVESVDAAAIDAGESRRIPFPQAPGKVMVGHDYLQQFGIPNFYFHLTHAYAILRHNGVPLGKMDFLGRLTLVDA